MGRTAPLVLLLLTACASSRAHRFLAERTEGHVFARPITEVWPVAKKLLEERGFPPDEPSPYRLQTAMLSPDGTLPALSSSSASMEGMGRGAGGRGARQPGAQPPTKTSGEVWRFLVTGAVVDDHHCTVRFIRYVRDSFDSPESNGDIDADLEWALISRVEPDVAAALRHDAGAAGVTLPP